MSKKDKKILGMLDGFKLSKKLHEIDIDKKKYACFNLVAMIILIVLLIAVNIYFLTVICNALTVIISIFTVFVCLIWSILSYKTSITKVKYILYKNAIVKDFDNSIVIGKLSELSGVIVKTSLIDRFGKTKTKTLVLKFENKMYSKIVLFCIKEDIENLVDVITLSAKDTKAEKLPTIHPDSIINKIIKNMPPQSKISQENNRDSKAKKSKKNKNIVKKDKS